MAISIPITCVNTSVKVKNALKVTPVLILTLVFNNYINIRPIKKNFALTTPPILLNVNMEPIVLLPTVKIKYASNSFITTNSIKISTCFIIKPNSVPLILQNMIKHFVSMPITYKITEGTLPFTITSL
jgi:hypothetical protein